MKNYTWAVKYKFMNQGNNDRGAYEQTETNTQKSILRGHVPECVYLSQIYPYSLLHAGRGVSAAFRTRQFRCCKTTFKRLNAIINFQPGFLYLSKSRSQPLSISFTSHYRSSQSLTILLLSSHITSCKK